jgi:hypothetical protein
LLYPTELRGHSTIFRSARLFGDALRAILNSVNSGYRVATFGTIARRARRKLREHVAPQPIISPRTRRGRCCRAAAVDGRVWLSSISGRWAVDSEKRAIKRATWPTARRVLDRGLDSDPVVTRARSASVFCSCSNPHNLPLRWVFRSSLCVTIRTVWHNGTAIAQPDAWPQFRGPPPLPS